MESDFLEFCLNKDKTLSVCICLKNILYVEFRTADKTRMYLIDGTILDVYESYGSVCSRLINGRETVEN